MAYIDVFNGDADGICALIQLRRHEPADSTLVTGVKRDIALLKRVQASPGDTVTVLDVAVEKNQPHLDRLLAAGVIVDYTDHHTPGELPTADNFVHSINTSPEICTSALINGRLAGAQAPWAVVGCFGDNLDGTAERLKATLNPAVDTSGWREFGILINYNGYGADVADLHFHPADLYRRLQPHNTPTDCLRDDPDLIATLRRGYQEDMDLAESAEVVVADERVAVIRLPNTSWARRVSGVFSNALANEHPERAHAVLTDVSGGLLVSVRAPIVNRKGADTVCRQFATGGGRPAAAGINLLPEGDLEDFVRALRSVFDAGS